jgi:amidophosphoribosyltransferase
VIIVLSNKVTNMCGVIGVVGSKTAALGSAYAAYEAYRGLLTLQHRGQDAAGVLSWDQTTLRFYQEKDLGLVADVFNRDKLEKLRGHMAIGHTRYATAGGDGRDDLQPLVTGFPLGIGMVHNGNLVNYHSLARRLQDEWGVRFLTNNDLEIFLQYCSQGLSNGSADERKRFDWLKLQKVASAIVKETVGAYALVGMISDEGLFGLRDPNGIRPLVIGQKMIEDEAGTRTRLYCLTSETQALNFLGYEYLRDVAPGELVFLPADGEILSFQTGLKEVKKTPCMFEWVYFSAAESTIEGRSVYSARLSLGQVLAKKIGPMIEAGEISPDIVCPVPDTSRTASISLSEELKIPYREALIKNRYIQRSFILNSQDAREKAVELKLSPVRSEIEGKSLLLVDDSIVRGTTSKKIIALLKRHGAREVSLAVTCAPIRYACYYGIDFPSPDELAAKEHTAEVIAEHIGAKKVIFLEDEDIRQAIGLPSLCMACLNNTYPTSIEEGREFAKLRRKNRSEAL